MQFNPTAFPHTLFEGKDPDRIVSDYIYPYEADNYDEETAEVYSADISSKLWPSDSMILYNATADAIEQTNHLDLTQSLGQLIAFDGMLNEYQLDGETIMGSLTPTTARSILDRFATYPVTELKTSDSQITNEDIRAYFTDWVRLLSWAAENNYALVFHCG